MGSGIFFPICALPFSILILILFLKKEHIDSIETKIYKVLILVNFFGLLIELLCSEASMIYESYPYLSNFIYKTYLVYLLNWTAIFTYYVFRVSTVFIQKFNKIKRAFCIFAMIVVNIVVYMLPITLVTKNENQIRYTTGASVVFSYIMSGVFVFIILFILFKNHTNIKRKKYIPVFIFFVVGTLAIIIQFLMPQLLLITYVETFICVIMYFTIENPDMKLLNEFIINRKLTETSIEEKSNLLFQVSQEVKNPLIKINDLSCDISKTNDIDTIHLHSSKIEKISRDVTGMIDNVLDISQLEKHTIPIAETKYNIYKLLTEIIYLTKNKYKKDDSNISFKYNISNSIPQSLYGDSIKIKQVICSILFNAFENTKSGFVDLDVTNIIKYDMCRVIISISDSGKGMNLQQINDILKNTDLIEETELMKISNLDVDLKITKKIIDIMGGSLLIKSEPQEGTTVTVILNQKIDTSLEKNKISALVDSLSNKKKVLLIDDDYLELDLYAYQLRKNNLDVTSTMYCQDCIARLENQEYFDLIIVDDELQNYNAIDLLKEIQKSNFKNQKIIIMLEKEKKFMKEKFLEDYPFADYLLKDDYKAEIKRIYEKYL